MLEISLQGEQLQLLPEKALWWPGQKTIIISDLHWGKSGHFRANGIAIPENAQRKDENRLAKIIQQTNAERLIIAGDLFHSKHNNEIAEFTYWRQAHRQLHIDFIMGNHDILKAPAYTGWDMQVHTSSYFVNPFLITHDMVEGTGQFIIHGHVHPAIRITGKGNQSIKLCCYCEDENRLILPAFGSFTGSHLMNKAEHKHIYIITDSIVMKW